MTVVEKQILENQVAIMGALSWMNSDSRNDSHIVRNMDEHIKKTRTLWQMHESDVREGPGAAVAPE